MSAGTRVTSFAALVAAIFATAAWAGSELDPAVETGDAHREASATEGHGTDTAGHAELADAPAEAAIPGLAVAERGYRLELSQNAVGPGRRVALGLRIVGPDGETVQDFDVEHERRLHLIVIRRDFVNFQHLHPRQLGDGSWRVEADLEPAGVYRVFADFATDGAPLTLAADLFVRGAFEPQPLPAPRRTTDAGDGYEVRLNAPPPVAGERAALAFSVSRHGRELETVEPYLGADGHLVVLREHDQAFLHAHPEGVAGGAGPISFGVDYPSAGRYRLFLQFKDRGRVHTASFTQVAGGERASDGERP